MTSFLPSVEEFERRLRETKSDADPVDVKRLLEEAYRRAIVDSEEHLTVKVPKKTNVASFVEAANANSSKDWTAIATGRKVRVYRTSRVTFGSRYVDVRKTARLIFAFFATSAFVLTIATVAFAAVRNDGAVLGCGISAVACVVLGCLSWRVAKKYANARPLKMSSSPFELPL